MYGRLEDRRIDGVYMHDCVFMIMPTGKIKNKQKQLQTKKKVLTYNQFELLICITCFVGKSALLCLNPFVCSECPSILDFIKRYRNIRELSNGATSTGSRHSQPCDRRSARKLKKNRQPWISHCISNFGTGKSPLYLCAHRHRLSILHHPVIDKIKCTIVDMMSKLSPSKHQAMLLKFMFRFSFVQFKSCPTFFNLSLHILVEHFFSCLLCMCPKFNVFICSSTSVIMAAGAFTSASRTITRVVAGAFLFVHSAVSPQPRTVQPLIVVMHQIVDHTYSL